MHHQTFVLSVVTIQLCTPAMLLDLQAWPPLCRSALTLVTGPQDVTLLHSGILPQHTLKRAEIPHTMYDA